jgi:hypothetical protein
LFLDLLKKTGIENGRENEQVARRWKVTEEGVQEEEEEAYHRGVTHDST